MRKFVQVRVLLAVVGCLMFLGVGDAFAGNLQKHTFEISPEVSHIKYEEPGLMKQSGIMYGIRAAYTYRANLMLRVEGKYSTGKVDYDGHLIDFQTGVRTPYKLKNITDYMLEFRGLGGYIFPVSKTSHITPYVGIGYRYLNNDMSKDPFGYERESNYIYSPVGVRYDAKLSNGWSFGAEAEYNIFWWGRQVSHLNDIYPGFNVIKNRQKEGYGLRGSVEFAKKTESVELALAPYIKYWNIGESERADLTLYGVRIGEAWEPKNRSTEIGLSLVLKW